MSATDVRSLARSCRRTWVAAVAESLTNRRSFWIQIVVMIVNDAVWILFWVFFFQRVDTVRGWDVNQIMVLLAVLTTSAGVVLGLLANARRIGQLVVDGGLDATLALPTSPLPHLLVRRVETTNVGDLVFGIALFVIVGNPTPQRTALFVFGVACSIMIMVGFLVMVGSSAFFVGRNDGGELGFNALLLFSAYPVDIFAGLTKFFLYAVVPAGFIASAQARLIGDFEWRWAAGLLAVAVALSTTSWFVFNAGLRRYTSGAVWTEA